MDIKVDWAMIVFAFGFWVWAILVSGDPDLIDGFVAALSK